jgi:hypothetical protein
MKRKQKPPNGGTIATATKEFREKKKKKRKNRSSCLYKTF